MNNLRHTDRSDRRIKPTHLLSKPFNQQSKVAQSGVPGRQTEGARLTPGLKILPGFKAALQKGPISPPSVFQSTSHTH